LHENDVVEGAAADQLQLAPKSGGVLQELALVHQAVCCRHAQTVLLDTHNGPDGLAVQHNPADKVCSVWRQGHTVDTWRHQAQAQGQNGRWQCCAMQAW
jgi:hypothetical protein